MLALTRKTNEAITIATASGELIEIHVVSIQNGQVRLGLEADRSISIVRSELLEDVA